MADNTQAEITELEDRLRRLQAVVDAAWWVAAIAVPVPMTDERFFIIGVDALDALKASVAPLLSTSMKEVIPNGR